jgi:tryptophan synthase alpha chain
MKNRLTTVLEHAKRNRSKLFCAYITLGYPTLAQTERLVVDLEASGTDILELGFPFSDPLADGPTIQHASQKAIQNGIEFEDAYRVVRKLRKSGLNMPVLLFSYFNPLLHFGVKAAAQKLKESGFDGAIIPDLPPEEASDPQKFFKQNDLSLIYLVAPTTNRPRMKFIANKSTGFIYYVSLRGVTGTRTGIPKDLKQNVHALHLLTNKPVLVGFGVSNPSQAKQISSFSDGVVVGSGIVDRLKDGETGFKKIKPYVVSLVRAVKKA